MTIQRGTDGTTLFLRQWHLCRDYTAKWENIADHLEEVARYGDPMNYELGLFGDYTVEVSKDYKFGEGLLTILGEVMAGGNLIRHNGFMVCQIAANA